MSNLFHIQKTEKIQNPWTHWFFYGSTGSGKTTNAATFPNPLFLVPVSEGSELSLAGLGYDYIKVGRDSRGATVEPRKHMAEILKHLSTKHALMRSKLAEGDEEAAMEAFPWETIVFESMTHYCAMLQDDVSGNGTHKMDQQRWGLIADHLRMVHSTLRTFDCHVVFTALSKVDGEGTAVEGSPDIVGKMARMLPSACDVIGFCENVPATSAKGKPLYRVHFQPYRVYPARTRFREIPGVVENFDFNNFSAIIVGTGT